MHRLRSQTLAMFALIVAMAFAVVFQSGEAAEQVDLLSICETCAANFITQDYQEGWEDKEFGNPKWKLRMANKLHIYLMALSMYGTTNFDKFDEDHFEKACFLTTRINGWSITNTTGFGGRSVAMRLIKTNIPKVYRFVLPYGPYGTTGGTASVILSDNESYTVFEFCFDMGLRTFAVFGTDNINDERGAIKLHLKAIGFNEKNFAILKPNQDCVKTDDNGVLEPIFDPTDLPKPGSRFPNYPGINSGIGFPITGLPLPPLYWKKK